MATRDLPYTVEDHEIVAATPDLRMVVLTLAAGQEVPWHWHSNVTDNVICLEGPLVVETRAPRGRFELNAGEPCACPARPAHPASSRRCGTCQFAGLPGRG